MERFKHNKKRNSAFLYEVLILELTKAIISNDLEKKRKIRNFIKESFHSRSQLYGELKLYNSLIKSQQLHPYTAEKILAETKKHHQLIDKKELAKEQNAVVRYINQHLPSTTFSNFVPNYKSLATIYQVFNRQLLPKSQVLLENKIISGMIKADLDKSQNKMVPVDNLVYKSFVSRFNKTYSSELLKEQKELLSRFIGAFADNGISLKIYLDQEIGRLKASLQEAINITEIQADNDMERKTQIIIKDLQGFGKSSPDVQLIEKVIKIQSLVNEINS